MRWDAGCKKNNAQNVDNRVKNFLIKIWNVTPRDVNRVDSYWFNCLNRRAHVSDCYIENVNANSQ